MESFWWSINITFKKNRCKRRKYACLTMKIQELFVTERTILGVGSNINGISILELQIWKFWDYNWTQIKSLIYANAKILKLANLMNRIFYLRSCSASWSNSLLGSIKELGSRWCMKWMVHPLETCPTCWFGEGLEPEWMQTLKNYS